MINLVSDKTSKFEWPFYTDSRFEKPQTVYSDGKKGTHCEYSDRLIQWDRDGYDRGLKQANTSGNKVQTAGWVESYLAGYYQKPVELHRIDAAFNLMSGYPYFVYYYTVYDYKVKEIHEQN